MKLRLRHQAQLQLHSSCFVQKGHADLHALFACHIIQLMDEVSTITLPIGIDADILVKNGKIGYTFQWEGQNYGNAVRPKSKKVKDIVDACMLLIINAEETYKELIKNGK